MWAVLLTLTASAADAERGAVLAGLGGCASCHTADDGEPYAGGHAIQTRFGTFYGSNITPDVDHGIGAWEFQDFARAMHRGRGPSGAYWPAFPYPAFTRMVDEDVADLWAFLQTIPAVSTPDMAHDTTHTGLERWLYRAFLFEPKRWRPKGDDPELDRGAYLVEVVGHCGECHTPRGNSGRLDRRRPLAGGTDPPYPAPNLTPHEDGLQDWSPSDLETFLEMGMDPEGDFAGRGMRHVVRDGTALLPADDRAAIVRYLLALDPLPDPQRRE